MSPPASQRQPPGQQGVHRRFLHGATGKMLAMGVQIAEQVLLVPVFLYFWGRESYGDWIALLSVAGFILIVDLGLQGFYGNALQMAWARGDRDAFARTLRQGIGIYAALIAIVLPVVALGGWMAPWPAWLNLAATPAGEAARVAVLLGLAMLSGVPFGMVVGLYRAQGEFALGIFVSILLRLALVLATALALWQGARLAGLAAMHLVVALAGWGAVLVHQRRRYPALRYGIACPRGAEARTLATVAPFYALIPAAMALSTHGTVVAIAGLAGAGAAVVGYTTLRTLTGMARSITEQIAHVAGTEFARQYAQDDMASLQRLYRFTGRMAGGMAGALAGLIAVIGPPFLGIWTLGRIGFAPDVFWPLLAAAALSGPTLAGTALLFFINRPQGLALVLIGGGAAAVALALALVPPFGAAGAAIAVLTAEAGIVGLAVPTLAARVAGMSAARGIAVGQLCAAISFAASWAAASAASALIGGSTLPELIAVGLIWLAVVPWPLAPVLFDAGQRRWIRDRLAARLHRRDH